MAHAEHTVESSDFVARGEVIIDAPVEAVWRALTDTALHGRVMFGAEVETDWQEGSPIVWRGDYEGRSFEDKGAILELRQDRQLKLSHFSPMSGEPDEPDSYHIVDIRLEQDSGGTLVALSQTNNPTEDAAGRAAENWSMMLQNLKKVVEQG